MGVSPGDPQHLTSLAESKPRGGPEGQPQASEQLACGTSRPLGAHRALKGRPQAPRRGRSPRAGRKHKGGRTPWCVFVSSSSSPFSLLFPIIQHTVHTAPHASAHPACSPARARSSCGGGCTGSLGGEYRGFRARPHIPVSPYPRPRISPRISDSPFGSIPEQGIGLSPARSSSQCPSPSGAATRAPINSHPVAAYARVRLHYTVVQ
jgi:hypothetical protein